MLKYFLLTFSLTIVVTGTFAAHVDKCKDGPTTEILQLRFNTVLQLVGTIACRINLLYNLHWKYRSGTTNVSHYKINLFADATQRDGTYGLAEIEDVRISDCPDSPCKLRKGTETTIEFDFKPDKVYEKLTTSVFGGIGIIRVPFREVHGVNACKDIVRKSDKKRGCPLMPEHVYTYSNSFPILKNYPAVNVQVQYGLNDKKTPIVCFTLPAKITN